VKQARPDDDDDDDDDGCDENLKISYIQEIVFFQALPGPSCLQISSPLQGRSQRRKSPPPLKATFLQCKNYT